MRGLVEPFKNIQSKNGGRQSVCDDRFFLAFPKTAETKNGGGDTGISKRESFLWQCDAEPLGARGFKRTRALDGAVAVSVGFHGGHDCDTRAQRRLCYAKVVGQVVEIDFSPGGPLRREI